MRCSESSTKRKFSDINTHNKNKERPQINDLNGLYPKELEKDQTIKASRRKEKIKARAEFFF